MKRSFFFAITCLCLLLPDAESQEVKPAKNSLFFELFGNGGLYSINFERAITPTLYGRLGFTSWSMQFMEEPEYKLTALPFLITHITGTKKSHFEIGGGFLFGNKKEEGITYTVFDLTGFLGYRYQKSESGFLFRIGITPLIPLSSAYYPSQAMTSFGLSFGYHF